MHLFACAAEVTLVPAGGGSDGPGSSGGNPESGGTIPSGGQLASGGSASTGGLDQAGGVATSGGVMATGGIPGTGGVPGSGGIAGTGGAPGSGGVAGTGGDPSSSRCGENLLPIPADPGVRGPWKVGVRTVKIGRLDVEVTYPAQPGSTEGLAVEMYNVRDWLPASEQPKVSDAVAPEMTVIDGDLFRDVPVDVEHGPYPMVVMIHGTASMRIAALSSMAHWASRGFVVLGADYPGLGLADKLNENVLCPGVPLVQDVPGDIKAQMDAAKSTAGPLAFLAGLLDAERVALAGHSQGGCLAATLASQFPNVQVVVAQSASSWLTMPGNLKSYMYISGVDDTVIGFDGAATIGNTVCPAPASTSLDAYNQSVAPKGGYKRLVGIQGGGHLLPTDLCRVNDQGRNAIEQAKVDGVCAIDFAVFIGLPALFDCGTIDMEEGLRAVNYATTAQIEETLHCIDHSASFANMQMAYPQISVFEQSQ